MAGGNETALNKTIQLMAADVARLGGDATLEGREARMAYDMELFVLRELDRGTRLEKIISSLAWAMAVNIHDLSVNMARNGVGDRFENVSNFLGVTTEAVAKILGEATPEDYLGSDGEDTLQ